MSDKKSHALSEDADRNDTERNEVQRNHTQLLAHSDVIVCTYTSTNWIYRCIKKLFTSPDSHFPASSAGGDQGGERHWSDGDLQLETHCAMCPGSENGSNGPGTNLTHIPLQRQAYVPSSLQTVCAATSRIFHPGLGSLDGGRQELSREGAAKSYQDGFRTQEQY